MTFIELYQRILPLWGDAIHFEDAMFMAPQRSFKNQARQAATEPYFYSKKLSNQWNAVEEKIDDQDAYGKAMVWTLYQVFHRHAQRKFEQQQFVFSPSEIEKKEIEQQLFTNLNEQGWEEELAGYERILE